MADKTLVQPVHHEQWSPAWAWLILVLAIAIYVAVFDIHAYIAGTQTMSGQFRTWLFNPTVGPFAAFVWVGTFAGLTWHWIEYRGR